MVMHAVNEEERNAPVGIGLKMRPCQIIGTIPLTMFVHMDCCSLHDHLQCLNFLS